MTDLKSDFKIISPTERHINDIAILMDEYRVFYGKQSNFSESKDYVSQLFKDDEVDFLMAVTAEEKLIGFCTLFRSYSSVEAQKRFILNDLYVRENFRQCGYGTQLLDAAVTLAKKENINSLKLETAKDNVIAQSVYEKHGWKLNDFLSFGFYVNEE